MKLQQGFALDEENKAMNTKVMNANTTDMQMPLVDVARELSSADEQKVARLALQTTYTHSSLRS
jgi:hypothetical protein